MTNYARMYRFGITPWERYATAAASSIAVRLDREETGRSVPWAGRSTWAAAAACTPSSSRAGGGRPSASTMCRPRSRRHKPRAGTQAGSATSSVT